MGRTLMRAIMLCFAMTDSALLLLLHRTFAGWIGDFDVVFMTTGHCCGGWGGSDNELENEHQDNEK